VIGSAVPRAPRRQPQLLHLYPVSRAAEGGIRRTPSSLGTRSDNWLCPGGTSGNHVAVLGRNSFVSPAYRQRIMPDVPFSPFASPNAIPPRTSSQNIPNAVKQRSSVLRPLSENAWISQSNKSKHSHGSAELVRNPYSPAMSHTHAHSNTNANNAYSHSYPTPAPMSSQPPDPLKGVGDDLIYRQHSTWTDEKERILLGPFDYLYGHPGKDIRSQLIAAFNQWLNVPPERLDVITRVVGMLHTASLLYGCPLSPGTKEHGC
jgi:hypothetical protein